jgi:hypothetical protein
MKLTLALFALLLTVCTSAFADNLPQKQGSDADDAVYFSDTKNMAKAGCSEVKDTLVSVTSELLTVYPWIGSSVLVDLVTREAVVPETGKFLKLAQEQVKAKGLNHVFSLQTGSPDKGLVGALFTYHGKGVYWMEVYQEASEDGKTKHTSIGGMAKDGILPVETIKFSANHYTHTTPNGTTEGTF